MAIPIHTEQGHAFLHVRRIVASRPIPAHLIRTMEQAEVRTTVERHTGDMMVELTARIAGKDFDEKTVTYPATWWEAFKAQCLPTVCRWLKHTPRVVTVKLTASAFYPDVRIPNHKAFVQVTLRKQ